MMTSWHASRFISREAADMLLSLPDVRQTSGHTCGDAASLCALAFHGVSAVFRLANKQQGADPVSIESKFRQIKMKVVAGEMTVDDLRYYCNSGRPVICLVHWPDGQDSHYVCVAGVSRGHVHFQDPESGPGKCSIADFDSAWWANGRIGDYCRWGIAPWVG